MASTNLKSLLGAAAVSSLLLLQPQISQAQVNLNINIGQPNYYGAVPMLPGYAPNVWNPNPIVAIGAALLGVQPIYLNVPNEQRLNWRKYCGWYNACNKPVHFVKNDWYRNTYAPAYRKHHNPPPPPKGHAGPGKGHKPPQGNPPPHAKGPGGNPPPHAKGNPPPKPQGKPAQPPKQGPKPGNNPPPGHKGPQGPGPR